MNNVQISVAKGHISVCMGLVLDIHLFGIKLDFVEILLYLPLYIPVFKLGCDY